MFRFVATIPFLYNGEKKTDSNKNTWIWTTWTPLGKDEDWDVEIDNEDTSWYALNDDWGAYRCNFIMGIERNKTCLAVVLEYIPSPKAVRECGRRISHFPQHILDVDIERFKDLVEHPVLTKIKPGKKKSKTDTAVIAEHPPCGI